MHFSDRHKERLARENRFWGTTKEVATIVAYLIAFFAILHILGIELPSQEPL
jgi:hypothetical protein